MIVSDDATIAHLLRTCRTVAIVGLSDNESRPSFNVAKYLLEKGYGVIPVNPKVKDVLGQTCYPDLLAIPESIEIDIVNCFRKSADIAAIVDEIVQLKSAPKVLWTQLGVFCDDSAQRAHAAGLSVVMDRCLKIEHARLTPDLRF